MLWGAALCAGLAVQWAHAEAADRQQPLAIEADHLQYDDARQISVFTGSVVLTKGSLVIRGGRVEVRQNAQGDALGTVTAAPGQSASFRQKRDGVQEFIEGEAQTLVFDSRADTLELRGQAQLRRLLGSTLNDQFHGERIVFNNQTREFTLDAAPMPAAPASAPASALGSPKPRVRAMLTPRAATSGAASAASAPLILRADPQ
ncbi:MAG: lipopolysaccharide transport periplasmic protein LptA [Rhodoferax sp.]